MDLIIAIALLCQANTGGSIVKSNRTYESHLVCQQNFLHCFNVKSAGKMITDSDAMSQCVQEKK